MKTNIKELLDKNKVLRTDKIQLLRDVVDDLVELGITVAKKEGKNEYRIMSNINEGHYLTIAYSGNNFLVKIGKEEMGYVTVKFIGDVEEFKEYLSLAIYREEVL